MGLFDYSPISKKLWDYYSHKYGQLLSPIGVLKACSVVSAKQNFLPTLSVFAVAPTRQFKSRTSIELMNFFHEDFYIDIGSDFTIHSMYEEYRDRLDQKCLFINDGTLLFASKSKRTKCRLINALAELLSEQQYKYGERMQRFTMKAKISVIMNMTLESYNKYESKLLGSTMLERFLTIFYSMPVVEQVNYVRERRSKIVEIKPPEIDIQVIDASIDFEKYIEVLIDISKNVSALAMKSFIGTFDQIRALTHSHAILNTRDYLCDDDINFINVILPYLSNPFASNNAKIIKLRQQGRSYKDIAMMLGKKPASYKGHVSRIIRKAKERGIIDIEDHACDKLHERLEDACR
jgi:hypothetical protein